MKDQVTLDDVARRAGVSPKTVSRVVNGEAHVGAETKAKVERAIEALGYRPNLAARSLAASRSFLVGVISPYLESYYFSKLHNTMIRACKELGLHVIVELVDLESRDYLKQVEHALLQLRFEGVILTQPVCDQPKILDLLERLSVRYVRIAPSRQLDRADRVNADQEQSMRLLAEHFWSLGHRRIASAVIDPRRRDPLRDAWVAVGGTADQVVTVQMNWRERPIVIGRQIAEALLALRNRPTAVFTFNDEVAAGAIGYAKEHGLRVPEDLSIAGHDDAEIAQAMTPLVTTIRQPLDLIARAAVELLTEADGAKAARKIICPVKLIVRNSTGAAPRR